MIFGLAILSRASFAQVTIKERVSITPGGSAPAQLHLTDGLGLVAPRSGVFMILPSLAQKASSQLPPDEHLVITTHDTVYSVPMLPILPCGFQTQWNYYDTCAPGDSQYVVDLYGKWDFCETGLLDTFYVKNVGAGDTVRFSYQAEYNSPTMGLHQVNYPPPGDTTWQIQMYTYPANVECYDPKPVLESCAINVMFADTVLRFSRPPSDSVYPTYPGHNNTPSTRNYLDLEVSTTFGDSFAPYAWVRIGRPTLVDSGGHSHDGARPLGKFMIQHLPNPNWDTVDTIRAQTDSTGKLKFRYLASQFGGVERIKGSLLSDSTSTDTLRLLTRVPGLELLTDGATYIKVGGRCEHHGPRDDNDYQDCRIPDNNHWGISRLIQAIQAIAEAYHSLHSGVRLRVNDMSLPYGGLFDVNGNWRPHHGEHRIGINADYSLQCRDSFDNLVSLQERDFREIVLEKTRIEPYRHRPPDLPHYHIYVHED
jgi:hypothetical protein